MTRDEIIRMAREAGFHVSNYDNSVDGFDVQLIEFAEIIAEKEREACAVMVDLLQGCGTYADAQARRCAAAIRTRSNKA